MQTHIINPQTKRMIGVKTKTAVRLAKTGVLEEKETQLVLDANKPELPVVQEDARGTDSQTQPIVKEEIQSSKKQTKKIKKEMKEIANENKEKFVGISQHEADELLKKMLYEKLFVSKPPKTEKKKKKKKRVVVQSSSSDSSESSESSESEDW